MRAARGTAKFCDVLGDCGHSSGVIEDCAECVTKEGMLDRIDVDVELTGPLTQEQHAKLMEVARKCPVHRAFTSEINIRLQAM